MSNYFFDTSALVKVYHKEVGTELVEEIYENPENTIYISHLTKVELISALCKKYRTNDISHEAFILAYDKFLADCINVFQLIFFYSDLLEEAKELILQYGQTKELRTLDAIQLATYQETLNEDCYFVCADKKLFMLLKNIGIKLYPLNEEKER